jgi:hypothetical protein
MGGIAHLLRRGPTWLKVGLASLVAGLVIALWVPGIGSTAEFGAWLRERLATGWYGVLDVLANATLIAVGAFLALRMKASAERFLTSYADRRGPADAPEFGEYRLLDDRSIAAPDTDELGRAAFVRKLVRTVVLPKGAVSLVVALEAEWGTGKSSVLQLLQEQLQGHEDDPLVVPFNPWVISGRDAILRAFFAQLSSKLLDEGAADVASRALRFGQALEDLLPQSAQGLHRLSFAWLPRLLGRVPIADLEEERSELAKRVAEFGRPIVVIVDDIDRLPADDIRAVFQLVKAVAAFDRITYLLAFDPRPVDRALRFKGLYRDGREFRQKVVQATIPLPAVGYAARERYLRRRIEDRTEAWKRPLESHETKFLDSALPLVLRALQTPRELKRVLNATLLASDDLRGEVNFVHVLVFETLREVMPRIVRTIRAQPSIVHPQGISDDPSELPFIVDGRDVDERRTDLKLRALERLAGLYPRRRQLAIDLLRFLFGTVLGGEVRREDGSAHEDARLDAHENVLKLLYQGMPVGMLSRELAVEFLGKAAGREAKLAQAIEAGVLPLWFKHMEKFATERVSEPGSLLVQALEAIYSQFETRGIDSALAATKFLYRLVTALPQDQRAAQVSAILAQPRFVAASERILAPLLREGGVWRDGLLVEQGKEQPTETPPLIATDRARELIAPWLAAVRSVGVAELLRSHPNAVVTLYRWAEVTEPRDLEVQSAVADAFTDDNNVLHFIERFPAEMTLDASPRLLGVPAMLLLQQFVASGRAPDAHYDRWEQFLTKHRHSGLLRDLEKLERQ